ncbi:ABC transporter permease [Nocardioides albidus]|uniref:ABC transporter permease n=1 Tax=Nocardioides albidus TaxID=1517589 RepID=A0A5C4W170_9ACTN|nr:ABC transporter permease [Nocardioides albidus]TNM41931.1 ABC transporter permease [Nocardioides albidus]
MSEATSTLLWRPTGGVKLRQVGLAAAGFVVWLGLWQWMTTTGPMADTDGLPTASRTLSSTLELAGSSQLWSSLGTTLWLVAIALAFAVVAGIAAGVAMGFSPVVSALLDPISQVLRPIPAVVWLPLLLMVLGPAPELGIAMGFLGGVWAVLVQAQVGVRDIDPVILETSRAMCLPRRLTLSTIVLPSAVPYFATGIRISAAFILMLVIGAGILGGAPGLGQLILVAQQTGDPARVFGLVLWSGLLGLTFNSILTAGEALLRQHRGGR